MSARGTKPRCGTCRALDHLDRRGPGDVPVCPKRRELEAKWERERAQERREAGVPAGPCSICKQGEKAVRVIYQGGVVQWVCRSCAELMRSLDHLVTGRRPEYEPRTRLRVVPR
jgi:hypothetical protein